MTVETFLPITVPFMVLLAALTPLLTRRFGRNSAFGLGAGFTLLALGFALSAPRVFAGDTPTVGAEWLPAVGVRAVLVLDGLSLLFALLILVIGALVMFYSARYFTNLPATRRELSLLVLFAASMLGLVLAGDAILLVVFWELTSITSFFLIGGAGGETRAPATRALLVTGIGGLALLASVVLMATVTGEFSIAAILSDPVALRESSLGPAILVLLLLAAFTKSAQVPFHFWLPGAMVAPTPVSTYLHAATMVKAGIYLLMRFTPLLEGGSFRYAVIAFGTITALVGAATALKQHDLKLLLAYSTVSQLGFIVALVGVGTPEALTAAGVHICAHGLYKATLFMVVGVIDKEAGSRDIRDLSGLRKAMPRTAVITGIAGLSMAGFPPLLGFVSKEEAFTAFTGAPGDPSFGLLTTALIVLATIFTFAYGARIFYGAFEGPLQQELYEPAPSFIAPPAVTALLSLVLGAVVFVLEPLIDGAAGASLNSSAVHVELTLWHGATAALGLSALTIAGGTLLFVARDRVDALLQRVRAPLSGDDAWDGGYDATLTLGGRVGEPFLSSIPATHLGWIGALTVGLGAGAFLVTDFMATGSPPAATAGQWALLGLLACTSVGVATASNRLAAVALLGLTGFLVAFAFAVFGAPDLVLTQLLIETLTIVLVVFVFRRLPRTFHSTTQRRRAAGIALGLALGVGAAFMTYALAGRRGLSEPGAYYLEAAPAEAGGNNVVNTILVDFRALDTLGEITVLAVAAIGVFALVRSVRSSK